MQGKLIIVSGPSGTGKTTIVQNLLDQFPELTFSISATTRSLREQEKEGEDYYFMTPDEFESRLSNHAFLEYEEVYEGLYYGTLMSELHRIWNNNQIPVLDIDVKGAINIKNHFQGNPLLIFIHPGSRENLRKRLEGRGTEGNNKIQKRLERAENELALADKFHHVLYNYNLEETLASAQSLVEKYLGKAG
jgi:guanylate kinase